MTNESNEKCMKNEDNIQPARLLELPTCVIKIEAFYWCTVAQSQTAFLTGLHQVISCQYAVHDCCMHGFQSLRISESKWRGSSKIQM